MDEVVASSPAVPARQRLAIYRHAYRARLRNCFRAEFPCLLHALGEELFDQAR